MGRISNLNFFNDNRRDLLKIKTVNDDLILFSKEEAREALITYIDEELDLFATKISENKRIELQNRIDTKLKQIECELVDLINSKVDKITENIVTLIIDRVIDEEVNKRFDDKIKRLRDSL